MLELAHGQVMERDKQGQFKAAPHIVDVLRNTAPSASVRAGDPKGTLAQDPGIDPKTQALTEPTCRRIMHGMLKGVDYCECGVVLCGLSCALPH